MRHNPFRWVVWALVMLGVVLFVVFVYPTRYRYEQAGPRIVRIDRFTGCADLLDINGWNPARSYFSGDDSAPATKDYGAMFSQPPSPGEQTKNYGAMFKSVGESTRPKLTRCVAE